ncbi:RHO1 GDP-GTP exchange protein 2 [Tulasnella sp. 408]|nr:RHO1 GDP-GTP exchange protein 2 [Tulasnella sp. 408]
MPQKEATPPRPSHRQPDSRPAENRIADPALLSCVAKAFRNRITLSVVVKDGLAYHDAFDGQEAVDTIATIIETTDRKVALLLGRAMGAQGLFHDVTYEHPLRDSPHEIYQFKARLLTPFAKNEMALAVPMENFSQSSTDDDPLPCGVFTFLADCYSTTCTRDALCYSIACPRRLEQQARLNLKPQPGLSWSLSKESLDDTPISETGTLWIHSIPPEIAANVSDQEKKRQEAINEVICTEVDFVRDMEYLRDCWVKPLRTSDIIAEPRRTQFVRQVFRNLEEIIAVNTRLRDALNERKKSYAIVETIGDIYLDVVKDFEPFVRYGSHQLYGKFEFESEKSSNAAFAQFVEDTERLPESRNLELNGYLTKPTTRLARYPLLLEVVLKYTSDDNPDKVRLVEVVKIIRGFLKRMDEESGKTESRSKLLRELEPQLVFENAEQVDLRLRDENRELLHRGMLKQRGGEGDNGNLQVFLFDHALLIVKAKTKDERFPLYKRPIPLELLVVAAHEEPTNRPTNMKNRQTIIRRNSFSRGDKDKDRENGFLPLPLKSDSKNGYPITFMHLGGKGYVLTLWANSAVGRNKWLEEIAKQQEVIRERSMTFDTLSLSEGFFFGENKVNCAAPFDHGSQIAYGTESGVYLSDLSNRSRPPVYVLALLDVMQVDVLEEYRLLVVLSGGKKVPGRSVMAVPLEALDLNDPIANLKRAKEVSSHASFFKAGTCLGRTLVSVVKASALSSTIKTLEPIDQAVRRKNKPALRKLLQGGNDILRVFKEFSIPTESSSIHFLKTKLCVECTKGFEIVDLETLDYQSLLDTADPSLDFVQKRENTRPIAIYRIENEFLLCYDEFAFYVNMDGWRARPDWIVHWEGSPTSFALHYPFVLAFEPTFIEIRKIDTGQLVQVIPGNNLRCLFADTPPSFTHSAATYTNLYARGNPYIYPQVEGASPQEQERDHPGTASSTPLSVDGGVPYTRDEIIVVSDDKVMAVRLAPPPASRQQFASGVASEEKS